MTQPCKTHGTYAGAAECDGSAERMTAAEAARTGTLNTHALVQLQGILEAAQGNRRVARMIAGTVFTGEARSISDAHGGYPHNTDDVRDLYLRVALPIGEAFWPVRDLMAEIDGGYFVADYRS